MKVDHNLNSAPDVIAGSSRRAMHNMIICNMNGALVVVSPRRKALVDINIAIWSGSDHCALVVPDFARRRPR